MKVSVSAGLLAAIAVVGGCGNAPREGTITLDPSITYQTIRGWEAAGYIASPCDPRFAAIRDAVVRAAVEDIGIDRIQVEIRSGAENTAASWQRWVDSGCPDGSHPAHVDWRAQRYATVNDDADPTTINWNGFDFAELDWNIENIVLPLKQRLEADGRQLFINVTYVAFVQQITSGTYDHRDPQEYAEFVLATYLHLRDKYGLVPDAWEAVLEPDNGPGFDGTLLGQAIAAAAVRLREQGFTPRFGGPSTKTAAAISYFSKMTAVPGVRPYLDEFSYHRYGETSVRSLAALADTAVRHGLPTRMLGRWFGYGTHEVLHADLKVGLNSVWQGRALGGLFDLDAWTDSRSALMPHPDVRFNRQYFNFIRRGAVRIEARSDGKAVDPLAFIHADGRVVVVVRVDRAAGVTVAGLPPARYGITYTTDSEYAVDLSSIDLGRDAVLHTAIPDRGVITIWAEPPHRSQ